MAPDLSLPCPHSADLVEDAADSVTLHASAVALGENGLLITGASGTGKSALALELMAHGARLVADDQVSATRQGGQITVGPPTRGPARIEARGLGILEVGASQAGMKPAPGSAWPGLACIVDLDLAPDGRLPPLQHRDLLGLTVPLISGRGVPILAAGLIAILRGATLLDPDAPI